MGLSNWWQPWKHWGIIFLVYIENEHGILRLKCTNADEEHSAWSSWIQQNKNKKVISVTLEEKSLHTKKKTWKYFSHQLSTHHLQSVILVSMCKMWFHKNLVL